MDAVYTAVASIANLYVENEVNTLILHGTDRNKVQSIWKSMTGQN